MNVGGDSHLIHMVADPAEDPIYAPLDIRGLNWEPRQCPVEARATPPQATTAVASVASSRGSRGEGVDREVCGWR